MSTSIMPRPTAQFLFPLLQVALTTPWPSDAFISPAPYSASRTSIHAPSVTLCASKSAAAARKKKKKNAPSSPRGGGFGSAANTAPATSRNKRPSSEEEAVAYPELQPEVVQSLVPSPYEYAAKNEEESGSVLSEEMYDRLEDIYGLEKFNFGGEGAIYKSIGGLASDDGEEAEGDGSIKGSLFDDILSGGGTATVSQISTSPLDALLSSPSTSTASAPMLPLPDVMIVKSSPTTQSTSTSSSFDLNSIPPFQKFRVLHVDPMVLAIDDFFTEDECDRYVQVSTESEKNQQKQRPGIDEDPSKGTSDESSLQPLLLGQSRTVGKDSRSKAQRTSTTWFHHYAGVPELMAKATRLLGLEGIGRWEEPQTVRYRKGERFTWHLDALSPEEAATGAGQRVATLLVYLKELRAEEGGATMFRDLGGDGGPLKVRPKKGSAILFFPAAGGIPKAPFDIRTLHCGEVVTEEAANEKCKWIAQLWLRERNYKPTAPAGNEHRKASAAIGNYCDLAEV